MHKSKAFRVGLLWIGVLSVGVAAGAQFEPPPEPAGNPLTEEKARLGEALFWDEQLSSTRTVSCGTCHFPGTGGDDARTAGNLDAVHPGADGIFGGDDDVFGSPGVPRSNPDGTYEFDATFGVSVQATGRRTASTINAGYSPALFWDGRAEEEFIDPVTMTTVLSSGAALESQALGPLLSDVEMAHEGRTWTDVLDRIASIEPLALAGDVPEELETWIAGRDYAALFEEAFGSPGVTAPRIGMAIASYERTQFTDQTPFDQWILTNTGLTDDELAGFDLFTQSSCDRCHQGLEFTDHAFKYIGLRPAEEDPGRFDVTGDYDDLGAMRTPTLRNVELGAPFMRNGRFATLEEVIDFYDRGGDFDAPNKDEFIRVLDLTPEQKSQLLAFITRPLTDPRLASEEPPFDRPRLYTESWAVPVVYGAGVAGLQGGLVPRVVAFEPAVLGNPNFTVAVFDALGGTQARLVIDTEDPGLTLPASGSLAFEDVTLQADGVGALYGSAVISLPSEETLHGSAHFGRWYLLDDGGTSAEAVSRVFRFKLFRAGGLDSLFEDDFESGGTVFWPNSVP